VPVARAHERDPSSGRLTPDEAPAMIFEIRIIDGTEAERLGLEQARVLWEVTQWVVQRRSENGQDRAA
jgi:hypothetical protein